MSRSARHALGQLVVATLATAVSLIGLSAVAPGRAAAQGCGPAPSGQVAVALVVDDGTSTPGQRCVVVGGRATGYDVLIAAGHTLRIEAGFLCAIDGVPATGCGNRPDFGGAYWRYFHASPGGSWAYSSVGGGGYRMPERCAIEGWRFATSASEALAPRTAPPPVTCEAAPVAPPVTAPPATAAPPGPAAPPPVVGEGDAPTDPAPAPSVVPGAAEGGAVGETTVSAPEGGTGDPTTTLATPSDEAAPDVRGDGADTADGADPGRARRDERAAGAAGDADGGGGSSALGALVALAVVAGLGGAAWWRSRVRRRGEEFVAGP
jgi:hypothetical protein